MLLLEAKPTLTWPHGTCLQMVCCGTSRCRTAFPQGCVNLVHAGCWVPNKCGPTCMAYLHAMLPAAHAAAAGGCHHPLTRCQKAPNLFWYCVFGSTYTAFIENAFSYTITRSPGWIVRAEGPAPSAPAGKRLGSICVWPTRNDGLPGTRTYKLVESSGRVSEAAGIRALCEDLTPRHFVHSPKT